MTDEVAPDQPDEPAPSSDVGRWRRLVRAVSAVDWTAVRDLSPSPERSRVLDEVCRAFVAELPVDGMAVSVMDDVDVRETVGTSGPSALLIEEEQFRLGVGPCYDAFAGHRPVLVADVTDPQDGRWPAYSAAVAGSGVRAIFAFPLQLGAAVIGAVDVYRVVPGLPDTADLAALLRATDLVALALLGPDLPFPTRPPADRTDDDRTAGDRTADDDGPGGEDVAGPFPTIGGDSLFWSRSEVHQATGLVLSQLGGTAAQALARMRAHAYATDRTLAAVSADIVGGRLVLTA